MKILFCQPSTCGHFTFCCYEHISPPSAPQTAPAIGNSKLCQPHFATCYVLNNYLSVESTFSENKVFCRY